MLFRLLSETRVAALDPSICNELHQQFLDLQSQYVVPTSKPIFDILNSRVFPLTSSKVHHSTSFRHRDKNPRSGCSSDSIEFSAVTRKFPRCLPISHAVSRRLYDSLIHDFLEGDLDHDMVTMH